MLVDIGGHHGIDINLFLDKHPDVPAGSLVIQDLEGVISTVKLATNKIKLMAHSFFDAQPIHGNILILSVLWRSKLTIDVGDRESSIFPPRDIP